MAMPTFAAGQRLTAATLQQLSTQIDSLTNPGWTSYNPTWAASGTAPAIGNGTLTGRYRRSTSSDLVYVEIRQTWGTTTTDGTGTWNWTLPVTASASAVSTIGAGQVTNSGDLSQPIASVIATTTLIVGIAGPWPNAPTTINSRGGQLSATAPFVMATADSLQLMCWYDAA